MHKKTVAEEEMRRDLNTEHKKVSDEARDRIRNDINHDEHPNDHDGRNMVSHDLAPHTGNGY